MVEVRESEGVVVLRGENVNILVASTNGNKKGAVKGTVHGVQHLGIAVARARRY